MIAELRIIKHKCIFSAERKTARFHGGINRGDSVGVSEARKILRTAVKLEDSKDWLK